MYIPRRSALSRKWSFTTAKKKSASASLAKLNPMRQSYDSKNRFESGPFAFCINNTYISLESVKVGSWGTVFKGAVQLLLKQHDLFVHAVHS